MEALILSFYIQNIVNYFVMDITVWFSIYKNCSQRSLLPPLPRPLSWLQWGRVSAGG